MPFATDRKNRKISDLSASTTVGVEATSKKP